MIPFRPADAASVGGGSFYLDMIVWLNGDRVTIGDRVGFNYGCYVNGYGGLTIGDRSIFGPYTMIHRANHEMGLGAPSQGQGWTSGHVTIGPDCWVGTKVTVLRCPTTASAYPVGRDSTSA